MKKNITNKFNLQKPHGSYPQGYQVVMCLFTAMGLLFVKLTNSYG